MLRKLTPFLTTLLAMLLDTAVIPVFYHGIYTMPLTLVVVLCIGLLKGRLQGLLFGMIGGLLIDITTGTLGTMTFFFMAVGFLTALIVDENNDRPITGIRFHLRRAAVAFILCLLGEIVFAVYHYFVTAVFEWYLLRSMVLRALIAAAMTVLLCPLLDRLYNGRRSSVHSRSYAGNKREVKYF
ncbi:MAG: rod shape-determining protein MreD [Candidatus Faecivicinus sp.]